MANLALIRGAAMAAPKFTDIRRAVEPGIQTFKNIQALKQKEAEKDEAQRKREDQIKFNLYANLPGLEDDLVPDKFKNIATQKALDIRQQQRDLINNKDSMDQFEFIDQMNKLNKQVGNLNKDFNAYKEWSANWVDLKDSDDLSSGMSAKDRETILDLVTGDAEPIMTDEGAAYKTADGTVHLLKNLPKPISIAYDKHLGIYDEMAKIGEGFGKAGVGNDDPAYVNRKTAVLANFKRGLTTEDALSLGADFLKVGGLSGEYSGLLKDISEDPSLIENYEFDDRDEFGKVIGKIKGIEGYKEFITDQYGQIADNMNSTLKKKYDQALAAKTKPTKTDKIDPATITGSQLAFDLMMDPVSRLKEVTTNESNFDEETGIFSFDVIGGTEAEPITETKEYNMTFAPDVIRLARDILNNEGETSANKTKIIASLKEFLIANKGVLNQRKEFYEERAREKTVNNVLDQLKDLEESQFVPPHLINKKEPQRGSGARARARQ